MTRDEKLDHVRSLVALTPHIAVDFAACGACDERCLSFCPAGCFTRGPDGIVFQYEGCLECGTCRVLCPGADWDYPDGGFGVSYRFG
ncbi:MAG: ferredoxin family protein [Bifidobacteriaceae bacterium]|jgi:ferredoxin like protein|nr:ferredoxin family protein [Bifidobacteriaceae bacterium]